MENISTYPRCSVLFFMLLVISLVENVRAQGVTEHVSGRNKNVTSHTDFDPQSILNEGASKSMGVIITDGALMVQGTAKVSADTASKWKAGEYIKSPVYLEWVENAYAGRGGVTFKGEQDKSTALRPKIYRPVFNGDSRHQGGGGGTAPAQYSWKISIKEEIKQDTVNVTVKGWFVVGKCVCGTNGASFNMGPIFYPKEESFSQASDEIAKWYADTVKKYIEDEIKKMAQDAILDKVSKTTMGQWIDLINDAVNLVDNLTRQTNILSAYFKTAIAQGLTLDDFKIEGANGMAYISYDISGKNYSDTISLGMTANVSKTLNGRSIKEVLSNEGDLQAFAKAMADASAEWEELVKANANTALNNAIKNKFGQNVRITITREM